MCLWIWSTIFFSKSILKYLFQLRDDVQFSEQYSARYFDSICSGLMLPQWLDKGSIQYTLCFTWQSLPIMIKISVIWKMISASFYIRCVDFVFFLMLDSSLILHWVQVLHLFSSLLNDVSILFLVFSRSDWSDFNIWSTKFY